MMVLAFSLLIIIVCSGLSTMSGIYKRSLPKTAEDCQDECEYKYSEISAGFQIASSFVCAGESSFVLVTGGGVCQASQAISDVAEAGSVFDMNNCKRTCSKTLTSEFEHLYNKIEEIGRKIEENGRKLLLAIGDLNKSILDNYFKDNRAELITADSYYENYKRSKTELSKNQYIEVILGHGRLTGRSLWPNGWEKLLDMVADGDGLKHNIYKNKAANHSYCSPVWYNFFSNELLTATMHISRAHYLNGGQLSERNIEFLKTGFRKHKESYKQACQGGVCCYSCSGTCDGFYTSFTHEDCIWLRVNSEIKLVSAGFYTQDKCVSWWGTIADARYCRGSSQPSTEGCCDVWKECTQDCPENCPKIGSCPAINTNTQLRQESEIIKNIGTMEQCSSKCRKSSTCNSWTWAHKDAGKWAFDCVLMSGYRNTASDHNTISGDKNCSPAGSSMTKLVIDVCDQTNAGTDDDIKFEFKSGRYSCETDWKGGWSRKEHFSFSASDLTPCNFFYVSEGGLSFKVKMDRWGANLFYNGIKLCNVAVAFGNKWYTSSTDFWTDGQESGWYSLT